MKANLCRNNKTQRAYQKDNKNKSSKAAGCALCDTSQMGEIYAETEKFYVIHNKFAYDYWDQQAVSDHLMIIPKRHIQTIDQLKNGEMSDYANLLRKYSAEGWTFYTRGTKNHRGSQDHLHTHLLQFSNRKGKFILFHDRLGVRIIK